MRYRTQVTWPAIALVALVSSGYPAEADGSSPTPTRCIARWNRPAEDCRIQEPVSVEAVGRDEESARELAMDRLVTAMDALRASHALGAPNIMRAVVLNATRACEEHLLQEAIVTCFPEPHLRDARYCHLQLPVATCGASQGFSVAGRAWRDGERARDELCGTLVQEIDYLGDDPQAAKACEAECWQSSHLECGLM